jgi:hypothetical protein
MTPLHFGRRDGRSVGYGDLHSQLSYETAESVADSDKPCKGSSGWVVRNYLIIDFDVFIVLVAVHAHFFPITAQPMLSPLSFLFDAFFTCLLCPSSEALPQSVAEKRAAGIRIPRGGNRGKEANTKIEILHCCTFWTRRIRA